VEGVRSASLTGRALSRIHVRADVHVFRRNLLAVLMLLALLTPGLAQPANAASSATTFITAFSDRGDVVGDGTSRLWRGAPNINVHWADDTFEHPNSLLVIDASSGGPDGLSFSAVLAGPDHARVTTGTYSDAALVDEQASGQPGMNVGGVLIDPNWDARGCSSGLTGTFTVRDIAPDLSRLWITYEQHCDGQPEALFGEIRYQEPGGDGDLLVAPTQIDWPAAYRGVLAHQVPVTLVNTGAAPVRVSSASITDGVTEFAVANDACGTLLPGDSCAVDVSYVPLAAGRHRGQLTIDDNTSAGSHVVPLSGDIIPGYTSWQMHSQEQEYLGSGNDYDFTPANTALYASANNLDMVGISTAGGWSIEFGAPPGQVLHAGTTYAHARSDGYPYSGAPTLEAHGDGGCTSVGSFHVREVSVVKGQVKAFAVTFRQHCVDDPQPQLVGRIAWHAGAPADPVPSAAKMAVHLSQAHIPTVLDGDTARVAGRIWRGGDFPWLPGKRVYIYARPRTGGAWKLVTSDPTDAYGHYWVRLLIHRNTDYQARFRGDRDHSPMNSPIRTAVAKWRVTLKRAGNLPAGRVRLRCAVLHGRAHQVVFLQTQNSLGQWVLVGTHHLNSRGATYIVVKRPTKTSGVAYRVVAKASYGRSPGPSGYVYVVHG
jgi:hypothetical protein